MVLSKFSLLISALMVLCLQMLLVYNVIAILTIQGAQGYTYLKTGKYYHKVLTQEYHKYFKSLNLINFCSHQN